ncbi:putative membrane protein [Candidatus Phytoplasma solani]|uniref:hypothetical protein n=1 Tax=Candidatus Phytoplasma solani TaxID=69896 RepID=UPI0032D9E15D
MFGYKTGFSKLQWLFLEALVNTFIPYFSYLFLIFAFNNKIKFNYKSIFFFLFLIIIVKTISRTYGSYYIYYDVIRSNISKIKNINNWVKHQTLNNDSSLFLIIMILNFIPIFINDLLSLFCCLQILFQLKKSNYITIFCRKIKK